MAIRRKRGLFVCGAAIVLTVAGIVLTECGLLRMSFVDFPISVGSQPMSMVPMNILAPKGVKMIAIDFQAKQMIYE